MSIRNRNPLTIIREVIGDISTAVTASAEYSQRHMKAAASRAGKHTDVIVL